MPTETASAVDITVLGFSTWIPSASEPSRRSWKTVTSSSTTEGRERHGHGCLLEQTVAFPGNQLDLQLQVADRMHRLEIEPSLQRAGHLVNAAITSVRRARSR